jgi:peroxiredoxin
MWQECCNKVMSITSGRIQTYMVLLASVVIITGLLLVAGCGLEAAPEIGHPAPDFTLNDLNGNEVSLSDLRGKVVFLNFWATWCPPCRLEMPEMEELYQEYKNEDIVIIGVDLVEYASSVRSFVEENGYNWIFVIDTTGEVAADYMVTGIPASFFIDKDGIIRALQTGAMSRFTMKAKLAEAME